MKKLMAAAAVVSALVTGPGWALADDGGKKTVPLLRGKSAHALFESSKGCVTTEVTVHMEDDRTQTAGGAKDHLKDAVLNVHQFYDNRLGPQCERLDPEIQDSTAQIEDPKMLIDSHLDFARLSGSATFDDAHTGLLRKMKFDIRWCGKGKKQRTVTREESVVDGKIVVVETEVEQRPAQASGFLTEGKTNHIPRPSRVSDSNIKSEAITQTTRKK